MNTQELNKVIKNYVVSVFESNSKKEVGDYVTSNNILTHIKNTPAKELPIKKKDLVENIERVRKEMFSLEEKQRINKLSKALKTSAKEAEKLNLKANRIAGCFSMGYSMGELIRVGVKKRSGIVWIGQNDSRKEYARSSKYSATHGEYDLILTLKDIREVEIKDGIPTINDKVKFISNGVKHRFSIEKK